MIGDLLSVAELLADGSIGECTAVIALTTTECLLYTHLSVTLQVVLAETAGYTLASWAARLRSTRPLTGITTNLILHGVSCGVTLFLE